MVFPMLHVKKMSLVKKEVYFYVLLLFEIKKNTRKKVEKVYLQNLIIRL